MYSPLELRVRMPKTIQKLRFSGVLTVKDQFYLLIEFEMLLLKRFGCNI